MPTNSIGATGRDYATPALWEAAIPTALGGVDYIGEMYNDAAFTAGIVYHSHSSSGANSVTLKCHAGQSFSDNASVRSNALATDGTHGVIINYSTYLGVCFDSTGATLTSVTIKIDGLQVKVTGSNSGGFNLFCAGSGSTLVTNCILDFNSAGSSIVYAVNNCANCVLIQRQSGKNGFNIANGSFSVVGCTAMYPTDLTSSTGIAFTVPNYTSNQILQSCAAFGFGTAARGSGASWDTTNSKDNGTNLASGFPGSGNVYNVSYTSSPQTPFTNNASTTPDVRTQNNGNTLLSAGFKNSTYPNDISGTARATPPTIGAWEVTTSPATGILRRH